MSEIKPVPCRMCGGDNLQLNSALGEHHMACWESKCVTVGPNRATKEEAIAAWNELMAPAQPAANDDDLRHRYIMAALTGITAADIRDARAADWAVKLGTETYELAVKK